MMCKPLCAYVYSANLSHLGDNPFANEYVKYLDIVYYSFIHIENDASLSFANGFEKYFNQFKSLDAKILCSINGAKNLSNICADDNLRAKLVLNLINFIQMHRLSGIDIDWEVPGSNEKSVEVDKIGLNHLAKELKEGMPKGSLLTIAVHGTPLGDNRYDYSNLNTYVDYYNIMNYDANIDGVASHLCPLYPVTGLTRNYSIDEAYHKLIQNDMDKEKMIISCAFYGKVYQLKEEIDDGIVIGKEAEYTASEYPSGTAHYRYICKFYNKENGFEQFYDSKAGATYTYNHKTKVFVTFDDEISIKRKIQYAKEHNTGIMFWDYGGDYQYQLLKTLVEKWKLEV